MPSVLVHAILLFIGLSIAAAIILLSLRRRSATGAASLIIFALVLIVWVVSDFLYSTRVATTGKYWLGIDVLAATIVPPAMLTFALEYTGRNDYLNWRTLALLAIEPVITQVLFWPDFLYQRFFEGVNIHNYDASSPGGIWPGIHSLYSFSLILITIIWVLEIFTHRSGKHKLQSGAVLIGLFIPLLGIFLERLNYLGNLDTSLIAFMLTGLFFTISLAGFRLLDLVPIPRELAVEGVDDGWMVLDTRNRIIDMNPAAEAVIGLPCCELYGQPAEKVLGNWPNLLKRIGDNEPGLDEIGSVKVRDQWRSLNLHANALTDRNGKRLGNIILWHDFTEHRKVEEARQRAHDEIFVLLRAIHGAASRTQGLKDFLAAVIYQIVYTFQSQVCIIFIHEKGRSKTEPDRLLLTAQHGLPPEALRRMASINLSSEDVHGLGALMPQDYRPRFIEDIHGIPDIPDAIKTIGHLSLLILPMVIDGRLLGLIGLARAKELNYRPEEMTRLTVLAEEIASLINSDRQRQLATILAERQRLERDLHDGVMQTLCGLTQFTEAVQLRAPTGADGVPADLIIKIGRYARQAVKEMRLYLFELSPIDFEHQSLADVLRQRLDSVEGHADIKTSLSAGKNFSVTVEEGIELYHIAHEALNNALRHAHATSVTVRLKQADDIATLVVSDNGCGFDPQKNTKGGLGLRTMQERASRIGGKLTLVSKNGKGTKITVEFRSKGQLP